MIVAVIAVIVASSGGALAATLITGANIKNGTVKSIDIANNSLLGADIKDGTIRGADVANGSLGVDDLAPGTVPAPVAFSRFKDAAVDIDGASPVSGTVLLTLPVPAGSYAANAKVHLNNNAFATTTTAECRLIAEGDFDQARAGLNVDPDANDEFTVPMSLIHRFASAGALQLRCTDFGIGTVVASAMKITAVSVGSIINTVEP